jgi:hypothetical protein
VGYISLALMDNASIISYRLDDPIISPRYTSLSALSHHCHLKIFFQGGSSYDRQSLLYSCVSSLWILVTALSFSSFCISSHTWHLYFVLGLHNDHLFKILKSHIYCSIIIATPLYPKFDQLFTQCLLAVLA